MDGSSGIFESFLAKWQNYYVIIGSASAALTGLQFIVITLIAQTGSAGSMREIHAFGTPTVVHFCTALLVSAIMVMPWQSPWHLAICLGAFGIAGVIYCVRVVWHARSSTYKPDVEDWLWYTAFPILAHLTLLAGAGLIAQQLSWSLFIVAVNALLFLLIGIHNSWDTVTYIAVTRGNQSTPADKEKQQETLTGRS